MDSFPYEILVHIFEYLPVPSRNQARLVNRSWYSACNDVLITKEEILNIPSEENLSTMLEVFSTLTRSKRSIINLKFGDIAKSSLFSENNASSDFWLNHGTKVRYLKFSRDFFDELSSAKVLECCPNLTEFHYLFCLRYSNSVDVLKILSDKNVILMKVTCLSFGRSYVKMNSMSEDLLKVFPNVQDLRISPGSSGGNHSPSYIDNFLDFCNHILKISSHLKHLDLELMTCRDSMNPLAQEKVMNVLAASKKLESLELVAVPFLDPQLMFHLSALTDLTKLYLFPMNMELSLCEFLVQILDIVPKLRYLRIIASQGFGQLNDNVVKKLSTSSLQTLKINCYNEYGDLDLDKMFDGINVSQHMSNDTLEELDLCLADGYSKSGAAAAADVMVFFLKSYRKLRHLSIGHHGHLSSTTFEVMRFHQANLKTLKTRLHVDKHSSMILDANRTDFPHDLEHLELQICSWFSSQHHSFSDFVLPQLKYLEVDFYVPDSGRRSVSDNEVCQVPSNLINFLLAIEKLPLLEYLQLLNYRQNLPHDLVTRQCESHRNLRYLLLIGNHTLYQVNQCYSNEQYTQLSNLFSISKFLRYVCHDGQVLRRNICTNEIQLCRENFWNIPQ